MTRRLAVVTLLALVAGVVSAAAVQQKPNFSGTWAPANPAAQEGGTIIVKHDETTLTQSHEAEGPDHVNVYKLDGKESREVLQSHGADIVSVSQASWKGDILMIVTRVTYPDGRKSVISVNWSLDQKGQLTIAGTVDLDGRPTSHHSLTYTKK